MGARLARCGTAALLGGACLCFTGCGVLANALNQSPNDNRLHHSTRNILQQQPVNFPRELDKQPLAPFTAEPGDVLLVQPVDLDSHIRLPGDQPVMLDGTIHLGRFGLVQVAGKTVPEIEALVKAVVETQTKNAGAISVRVVNRQSKVVYVLGEVNAPGAYPLTGRETVLDGILLAGGLTQRASRGKIIVSRPTAPDACRLVLPICYQEIVQHGDTTTNYQLTPGDRIFVPSACCWDDPFGWYKRHGLAKGLNQKACDLQPSNTADCEFRNP